MLADGRVSDFRRGVVDVNVANAKTNGFTAKNVIFGHRWLAAWTIPQISPVKHVILDAYFTVLHVH